MEKEKRKREFNYVFMFFLIFFLFLLPTPGLTHNYSTLFCTECRREKTEWKKKNATTAKERASLVHEKGTTENPAIQMLQVFF